MKLASEAIKEAVIEVFSQAQPVDLTNRTAFLKNLIFLYHAMRASEDLLELAALRSEAGSDLHRYFVQHLAEERQHDEWLAADLRTAGIDVKDTAIPYEAVAMVGSQFYLVNYLDPCTQLGYMLLMECFPKPLNVIDQLEGMHGKDLLRTMRYHAEHDVDHGADVLAMIDTLPEQKQSLIYESAVQSARHVVSASRGFR